MIRRRVRCSFVNGEILSHGTSGHTLWHHGALNEQREIRWCYSPSYGLKLISEIRVGVTPVQAGKSFVGYLVSKFSHRRSLGPGSVSRALFVIDQLCVPPHQLCCAAFLELRERTIGLAVVSMCHSVHKHLAAWNPSQLTLCPPYSLHHDGKFDGGPSIRLASW